MPRKRDRETKGERRKRKRAAIRRDAKMGGHGDPFRFDLDPLEFTCILSVTGGTQVIGGAFEAFTSDGRDIRTLYPKCRFEAAIVDKLLQIGRDKQAKLMARADDAAAIRGRREEIRERRKQRLVAAIASAEERGSYLFIRNHVPDLEMRSVLTSTNRSGSALEGSDDLIVSYRSDDGRYNLARERWNGGLAGDSETGRERVGVEVVNMDTGFATEKDAHSYLKLMSALNEHSDFNRPSGSYLRSRAQRLRMWQRNGKDMRAAFIGPPRRPKGYRAVPIAGNG